MLQVVRFTGSSCHDHGGLTEKALSPLVLSLELDKAQRFLPEDPKLSREVDKGSSEI